MFTICIQRLLSALITRPTPPSSSSTNTTNGSNGSSNHNTGGSSNHNTGGSSNNNGSSCTNNNGSCDSATDVKAQSDGLTAYDRGRIAALFDLRETDNTYTNDDDIYNDTADIAYDWAGAAGHPGIASTSDLNGNLVTDMIDETHGQPHIGSITSDPSLLLQTDSALLKSHGSLSDNNSYNGLSAAPSSSSSLSRTALHKALLYSSLLHLTDLVHLPSSSSAPLAPSSSSSSSSHAHVSCHQEKGDQDRVPTIFSYTPPIHSPSLPIHPSMTSQAFLPFNGCNLPRTEHIELPSPLSLLEMNDIPTLPESYWTAWKCLEEHWARGDEGSELGRLTRVLVRLVYITYIITLYHMQHVVRYGYIR